MKEKKRLIVEMIDAMLGFDRKKISLQSNQKDTKISNKKIQASVAQSFTEFCSKVLMKESESIQKESTFLKILLTELFIFRLIWRFLFGNYDWND